MPPGPRRALTRSTCFAVTKSASKGRMTVNETPRDDLTVIPGIGPVRQRWLREALGVETYEDLAAFSADELEARMKAAGRSVSRSDIERWIGEAQRLASPEPTEAGDELVGNEAPEEAAPEEEKWRPFASFVVEYQKREEGEERRTTVHHMEEDKDASWPEIVRIELCQWMLEQIGEPAPDLEEEMRAQDRERLEEELEEREAEARRQLEQALVEERARMQQTAQEEVEARRAEALRQLEEELAEERAQLRQALEQEIEERRADALQQVEAELAEERAETEQALEQELVAQRAAAVQALERELEEMCAEVLEEVEEEVVEVSVPPPAALEAAPEAAVEAPPEVPLPPSRVAVEKAIAFKIAELRAYQPPRTGEPLPMEGTEAAPMLLKHDSPFAILVFFQLEEADATALAAREATYTVQIHARDLSTGETQQLGRTQPSSFVEGKSSYTDTLSHIELPAGLYRLTVLVTSETTPPGVGYRVVPMLLIA